mmetsp:Transcript_8103/g.27718  ORF Transcript_8103/g.27718 Transcript_8103/m.27718 type:complete len:231 (+) Transcript_8103:1409-2101(+)
MSHVTTALAGSSSHARQTSCRVRVVARPARALVDASRAASSSIPPSGTTRPSPRRFTERSSAVRAVPSAWSTSSNSFVSSTPSSAVTRTLRSMVRCRSSRGSAGSASNLDRASTSSSLSDTRSRFVDRTVSVSPLMKRTSAQTWPLWWRQNLSTMPRPPVRRSRTCMSAFRSRPMAGRKRIGKSASARFSLRFSVARVAGWFRRACARRGRPWGVGSVAAHATDRSPIAL